MRIPSNLPAPKFEPAELAHMSSMRLQRLWGKPVWAARFDPVEELIACILSQHTSDMNSLQAFAQLQKSYPEWQQVIDADVNELADVIRSGGLANQKAPRIQQVLRQIAEDHPAHKICLDFIVPLDNNSARRYLMGLPGVGPKTAAIVLCFAMGRNVIPVDTHIFRVSWRLGLIDPKIGEAKAHDVLQALIDAEDAYPYHILVIRHGREVCKALRPKCGECVLADICRAAVVQ